MIKKILLIIMLFLIVGLFANGVKTFFFSPQYNENPEISDVINNNLSKNKGNNVSELPRTKGTASIFEGFKNFIINPVGIIQKEQEEIQPNDNKDQIQNYFNETATIIFPTNESLQKAISDYLANNNPQALEIVIEGFKKANTELYNIETPIEVQNIQNSSIWITNKIIEILESIIDADSKEEITKIINGNILNEIRNKTSETRNEIQLLKTQYNLDIIL